MQRLEIGKAHLPWQSLPPTISLLHLCPLWVSRQISLPLVPGCYILSLFPSATLQKERSHLCMRLMLLCCEPPMLGDSCGLGDHSVLRQSLCK